MVKFISYVGLGIHTWHANLTEHNQNLCCLMGNCSHLHKLINQSVSSQGLIVWKMWLNLSGRCNCKNSTHNMWQWSIWQSRWLLNFAEEPIIVATSEIFLEQGSCGHGKHEKCGEKKFEAAWNVSELRAIVWRPGNTERGNFHQVALFLSHLKCQNVFSFAIPKFTSLLS